MLSASGILSIVFCLVVLCDGGCVAMGELLRLVFARGVTFLVMVQFS